jgi:superfamily II DNA or RNA helicase
MHMLSEANIRSLLMDRYQYREMLDSMAGGEFWPRGVVVVVSQELAKFSDILERLAEPRWDLVIVDEVHRSMTGVGAEVLRRVGASAEHVVLAIASEITLTDVFPGEVPTTVEWRRDRVVNHDGTLLDTLPRPLLHEIVFSLSPGELSLYKTVRELFQLQEGATSHRNSIANSMLRCFQSSQAALEHSLQRLAEGADARSDSDEPLGELERELPEGESDVQTDLNISGTVAEIARRALQQIEEIDGDSKLKAFVELLAQLNKVGMPSRRICVLTNYLGTLYYLAAAIEDQGRQCQLLHGGMSAEERQAVLAQISDTGTILIATTAMLQGIVLPEVSDLVFYDIPNKKVALQVVLGRFDRFGRQTRLNVHALTPTHIADGFATEGLGLLRELITPHPGSA